MTMSGFRHPSGAMTAAVGFAAIAVVLLLMGLKSVVVIVVVVAAACFIADLVISLRR